MIKPDLVNGGIYHLYNRGVEKRDIFLDDFDYFRFVSCLYECNDRNYVLMRKRIDNRREKQNQKNRVGLTYAIGNQGKRELLVDVLGFSLMTNHYHLIVRQRVDNGIPLFAGKISNSHTGYFNNKYGRRGLGGLFQGTYKVVPIENNAQLMNLAIYVFCNPGSIFDPGWTKDEMVNPEGAIEFLNNYRWSSYPDSIGNDNFPSVTQRDVIWKIFGGSDVDFQQSKKIIKNHTENWIKSKSDYWRGITRIGNAMLD